MNGFDTSEGVILIAATNSIFMFLTALRPGRFDRQVVVPNPDIVGRDKILVFISKNVLSHLMLILK